MPISTTKIIAHRGYSSKYPENTWEAFRQSVLKGADGIELDVWRTRDNQIVIHHNNTLRSGHSIVNNDYHKLQKIKPNLLRLTDLFRLLKKQDLHNSFNVCVEIKGAHDPKTIFALKEILLKYPWISYTCNLYFMSFSYTYLYYLAEFVGIKQLVYLSMDDIGVGISQQNPFGTICLDASVVNKRLVQSIQKNGKDVWVYGAYNPHNLTQSVCSGVTSVIVNDVEFTQKFLRQLDQEVCTDIPDQELNYPQ